MAHKREGVTVDYLDMRGRGSSWDNKLVGGEPSEKAWGGWDKSVVINVHKAYPLNPKRWIRDKSKGATLSFVMVTGTRQVSPR